MDTEVNGRLSGLGTGTQRAVRREAALLLTSAAAGASRSRAPRVTLETLTLESRGSPHRQYLSTRSVAGLQIRLHFSLVPTVPNAYQKNSLQKTLLQIQ